LKHSAANRGRIFILRLEDREIVQTSIENYALKMGIKSASVQLLGGIDKGSKIIVGAAGGRTLPVEPMVIVLDEMYEVAGNGTIFCTESGMPHLHCHISCGRGDKSICGDIRDGVIVWHIMEVIITELLNCDALRKKDPVTGFNLLMPEEDPGC
jgi:predicted DNA-binding protein with PD1-like motif